MAHSETNGRMEPFIFIREYTDRDRSQRDEIVKNSYFLPAIFPSFLSACLKEITFQLIVACSAIMFIFFNISFTFCFLSIPFVAVTIYSIVYISHWSKMAEILENPHAIKIFVAEAYESGYTFDPKSRKYHMIQLNEPLPTGCGKCRRVIVGTISVDKHRIQPHSAWLHTLVVDQRYRRKGVAGELIHTAFQYAKKEQFETAECSVTECQDAACSTLLKSEFHIIQMYHKRICMLGKYEKYHLGRTVPNRLPL